MRRQKLTRKNAISNVSAAAKRAVVRDEKAERAAARKAAWVAGVCGECDHFAAIHGPRGCTARFCDCNGMNLKGA